MKMPVWSVEATPMSDQPEDVIPSLRGIPKKTLLRGEAACGIPRRLGMTRPTGTVLRAFSSLVVAEDLDVCAEMPLLWNPWGCGSCRLSGGGLRGRDEKRLAPL